MKIATLILSPGGNGNHLWDEILTTAGSNKYGDNDFGAPNDGDPEGEFVHWFRSMPSRIYTMGEMGRMVDYMRFHQYEVKALVPVRNWYCAAKSQHKTHDQEEVMVVENMQIGYPAILSALKTKLVPFFFASYGEAVAHPEYVKWILEHLGLPSGKLPEIRDGNAKWYEK